MHAMPPDFPHQGRPNPSLESEVSNFSTWKRIDFPGTILLVVATISLSAAFEEADKLFPWKSAYVITLLSASGVFWISLLLWEWYVSKKSSVREPILPWRCLTNRQMLGILL